MARELINSTVAIMMATYNGSKYISDQIESILNQTYLNWILFVHDDGSTDQTSEIVAEYAKNHPGRIVFIDDPRLRGGGSKENFSAIFEWVKKRYDFDYFMFCDQDDVWLSDKVEVELAACKTAEIERAGNDEIVPVLVHTDLEVVDSQLNTLGESFIEYRAIDPGKTDLRHLLVQNNITGCTMLWNKAFSNILDLSNSSIAMHDWWMALVASCFGKIVYIDRATIKYRQHEGNVVGATNVNSIGFILNRLLGANHVRRTLQMSFEQAAAFKNVYSTDLSSEQDEVLTTFCELPSYTKISRLLRAIKGGFLKQGPVQIIGELMFI